MKPKTLQEHLKSIQSSGGKALFKKIGRSGMSQLAKKAWENKKKRKALKNKK